jgi:hypothetical protein
LPLPFAHQFSLPKSILGLFCVGIFAFAPTALAAKENPDNSRTFESFPKLRHEILNFISGATERVWISTDYLTDGEIVSALFLAVYRKIDVKVLLGRHKANRYMSRLNYLKKNNVPVFLKPNKFKTAHPSAILADNRLMYADAELNFLLKGQNYKVLYPAPDEVVSFSEAFANAAGEKVKAYARPVPLVGRPRNNRNRSANKGALPRVTPNYSNGSSSSSSGTFTYDKRDKKRPAYMPSKLPKGTVWENKIKNSTNGGSQ